MTATGLKRLGFALAALLSVAVLAVLLLPLLVSTDSVRERVSADLRAMTGLTPTIRGGAQVSLFPASSISFDEVSLGDGNDPALKTERVTARLRFFPLLLGRVEIADVTLEHPAILVVIGSDGRTNWSSLVDTLARSRQRGEKSATFSEIQIINGRVTVRDAAHDVAEVLDSVELSVAWPSISKSFGATGRVNWRGQPVEAALSLADFAAALAGGRSGIKLRLAGAPIKAAFDGTVSALPTLRVDGTLAADGASLRDFLRWAGQRPLPGAGFGRFAVKAQTSIIGGTVALTGVNLELDGNSAEGVLTFAADGRKTLQGTLAADALDLTPYISTVRVLASGEREWSRSHLTLDGLASFDLDLRLSAAKLAIGSAQLGRSALGASLRGGHLTVTIGESQAFGGVLKGNLNIGNFETGVDIKAQMQFADVDLDQCLGQFAGIRRIEGKGSLAFALEGSGDSVMAISRTVAGTATLTGQNGAVTGINVEQLLRRLERRPLSGGGELRSGRTPYDKLTLQLKIANGVVTTEEARIDGTAVRIALEGRALVPERGLDLKGVAALATSSKEGAAPFELPFVVLGRWDDPTILPDAEALIRRSGAAAPLLNAVRDRRSRDAARAASELMKAAPAVQPAADQAAPKPAE